CVFASEIDESLRKLYRKNFGFQPEGDIRTVPVSSIPGHDILCAGFPCQPFSKAGEQQGFDCPKSGDLFDHALKIAAAQKPRYVLLENVPNLPRHNEGKTWQDLASGLIQAGYNIDSHYLSPHQFGIPQIRERVFVVGSRRGLDGFAWPEPKQNPTLSLQKILDEDPADARPLSPRVVKCLRAWQQFIKLFRKDDDLPSFPIWSMEFGATYPFEERTPFALGVERLREFRGSHGKLLRRVPAHKVMEALPSYARTEEDRFPHWKVLFIRQNREFFERHRERIRPWIPKILEFPPSLQKFEWNCKGEERDIWRYVIQFRASGVRVKRPTTAPSLVAMTTTQVPIIAWEKRYMTPRECARLQSMEELRLLPENPTSAFKALGNAVNVEIVKMVAEALFCSELACPEQKKPFHLRKVPCKTFTMSHPEAQFDLVHKP
ncbi:MAG: DNA (cytosine-5-)-methyltransferase, partial [Terriglobia bacterium]